MHEQKRSVGAARQPAGPVEGFALRVGEAQVRFYSFRAGAVLIPDSELERESKSGARSKPVGRGRADQSGGEGADGP
jgi:hypothetical protein